jgi:hypothetical protein
MSRNKTHRFIARNANINRQLSSVKTGTVSVIFLVKRKLNPQKNWQTSAAAIPTARLFLCTNILSALCILISLLIIVLMRPEVNLNLTPVTPKPDVG